jgi:hypothetical protein
MSLRPSTARLRRSAQDDTAARLRSGGHVVGLLAVVFDDRFGTQMRDVGVLAGVAARATLA